MACPDRAQHERMATLSSDQAALGDSAEAGLCDCSSSVVRVTSSFNLPMHPYLTCTGRPVLVCVVEEVFAWSRNSVTVLAPTAGGNERDADQRAELHQLLQTIVGRGSGQAEQLGQLLC